MPRKLQIAETNLTSPKLVRLGYAERNNNPQGKRILQALDHSFDILEGSHSLTEGNFIRLQNGQLQEDDVILVEPGSKKISLLYRRGSNANALYVTDLCNSHCLMCPQPPKLEEGVDFEGLLNLISWLPSDVEELGVTGGEPTLLNERLLTLLDKIFAKNPTCHVHILTNARKFAKEAFARSFFKFKDKNLTFGIPLYSSDPEQHDYIVQANRAFHQTIQGILNLCRAGYKIEIRVVLNLQTIDHLNNLVNFIYRSLPFVSHIALMGMEEMGYVKKNRELLKLNLWEHKETLEKAVSFLHTRGMNCSLYNIPLCHLSNKLHALSENSISDYKVSFNSDCVRCKLKHKCGGIFGNQSERTPVFPILNFEESA